MNPDHLLAKTWFYRFPLPDGRVTPSYHDGMLDAVHTTRVDMMGRAIRAHFGDAPIGGTSTVEWSSDFEVNSSTGETDVVKTVQEVYQAGLDNLTKLYGFKR